MGFLDVITGSDAADASKDAANLQNEAAFAGIREQRRARNQLRGDLSPYRRFGERQLSGLNRLINNPQAQLEYIQNNPFFSALADDATNRLMNIQAASGRLGTGDTPAALQNQLLLLGQGLLQQGIDNRFNAAGMGQNSAAQSGIGSMNAANSISDLLTQGGNAQAAGLVGAANARAAGFNNLLNLGMNYATGGSGVMLSDRRFKTDVEVLGELPCGIPICRFRYAWHPQVMVGVMAQDVEKVFPSAVVDVFGVKYVDYPELERKLH